MFLRFLEILFVGLFVYFIFSQIIRPFYNSTVFFPWFRKRTELEVELKEVQEEQKVVELEARIAAARGEVEEKRKRLRPKTKAVKESQKPVV